MINMPSPRNSGGFHADPVVIVHSSEVNGHSRRQRFIVLTVIATLVLSALIIGSVLLAKSLSKKPSQDATARMDATSTYLVSFDPAIDSQQRNILIEILKGINPNAQISGSVNDGILLEGASALDDAKIVFRVALDMSLSQFYTITDASSGEKLFQHCANPQDPRCSSNMVSAPGEQQNDAYSRGEGDGDCPPGFKGPDCVDCIEGRFGPRCEFECENCGRGTCNDGIQGDGQCICPEGFGGNCQECLPGRFGPDCLQKCMCKEEWGICDDGLSGTGHCTCINNHIVGDTCDRCDVGWTGAHCTLAEGTVGLNAFNFCGKRPDLIAITFDGWPTEQVVQELDLTPFRTTFFVRPGTATEESCSLVQSALQRGHDIQLGGYNGEPMEKMTAQQIELQLQASRYWLEQCLGEDRIEINQFRPPLDKFDNGRARFVSELGYSVATWNVEGNVGLDTFQIYSDLQSLDADSSIMIRFDSSSYTPQTLLVLSRFFAKFRPDLSTRFVLTTDCYVACTGGSGICRSEKGPGVFDSFQTIMAY